MSPQFTGRLVGALVLLAYACYLSGDTVVSSAAGDPVVLAEVVDNPARIQFGALLMLANSVVVAGIGILVFPIISGHDRLAAHTYLLTRQFEAVVMAVGVLFVLQLVPLAEAGADADAAAGSALSSLAHIAQMMNQHAMQIAMIILGVGSLLFCRALFRGRLVPRFLAAWGAVGYLILAAGEAYGILGYEGLMHYAVGGAFEVTFGVYLLVRGFPGERKPQRRPHDLRTSLQKPSPLG